MSPRSAMRTLVTGMGLPAGRMVAMRTTSLSMPAALILCAVCGCARKGDPVPAPPVPPAAPQADWERLRILAVKLPSADLGKEPLRGLDAVRVLYLPLGLSKPTAQDVFSRGEVVLERQRPALPPPGETLRLDLGGLQRPAGWLVVVAVRPGRVASGPSQVLPWMDPALD